MVYGNHAKRHGHLDRSKLSTRVGQESWIFQSLGNVNSLFTDHKAPLKSGFKRAGSLHGNSIRPWPARATALLTVCLALLITQCSKDPAAKLPELPAEYTARMKAVANTDFAVAAPAPAEPQVTVTSPPPTVIFKECASH
jgi:hypothetical protein